MTSWNRKQSIELAWESAQERKRERWSTRTAFLAIVGVNLLAWAGIAKLVSVLVG